MSDRIDQVAETHLNSPVAHRERLHGGDLSEVFRLTLADGQAIVAKCGALVGEEARMLGAIRASGAQAPDVLGVQGDVLLLEHLPETSASPVGWRALGQGLRRLHDAEGTSYGWPQDYAFGKVTIHNAPSADWSEFWADRRLLSAQNDVPSDLARRLDTLARRLPDLIPTHPPKALLHGDLWSGNALFSNEKAYLIDPACYYGHSEVDLAMLCLFGAPPEAFWAGYGSTEPGLEARRPIYQLWPALVHLRLFGSGYRSMVETRLAALSV